MKFTTLLPLAASTAAIVIPDDAVMQQITIVQYEPQHNILDEVQAHIPSKDEIKHKVEDTFSSLLESSKNALDSAFEWASAEYDAMSSELEDEYFDAKAWFASATESLDRHHGPPPPPHPPHDDPEHDHLPPPPPPPHHKPKHDRPPPPPPPPHDGPEHDHPPHREPGHERPPHHRPGHDRPHRPPHRRPHKSNHTVYELINSSKYTTKLAELINADSELVDLLNSTKANFTIFAPTDKAFEKIPEHGKKPSKEIIKKILAYHVSDEFYPAGRILVSRTVPTLLEGKYLSADPKDTPQRISTRIGFRGLSLNFYSRVVVADIFGSNGVIHGIDSLLLPPPSAARIITFLPSEFSTLELGLRKTGLFDSLNSTNHHGGTFFAPTNWAFTALGPKINAFLFSEYGRKYLTALLEYHVVANQTLYSDAFYSGSSADVETTDGHRIPRGKFHVDLPTLLKDRYLSIDIGRFGRLIDIRINGFSHVRVSDGVAKDGVIHALGNVLIPPKKLGGSLVDYQGEELTVEDLKERLADFVKEVPEEDADNFDL